MSTNLGYILLVDDDEVDAEVVVRAFKQYKIAHQVMIVPDGIEALKALHGEGGYPRVSQPFLILLDLNMPRMNGLEFLTALRQDTALAQSIVFVLTTSDRDEDKAAAYGSHIAGYLVKSKISENFDEVVTLLKSYWQIIEFPPTRL